MISDDLRCICALAIATRRTRPSTSTAASTRTIRHCRYLTTDPGTAKENRAVLTVMQFSTGNVGRHSLRAIIGRPDLELVGVHAASAEKIGRDAAELCGLDQPTGIIATDDIDALVALDPDCVVYTSQGETRPMEAIQQMATFLAAGTNHASASHALAR